jgi:hypothetical protein
MTPPKKLAEVVPLFRRRPPEEVPEVGLTLAPTSNSERASEMDLATSAPVDLAGKPPCWFLIGAGGTGKTAEARWLGWRMDEAGRPAFRAALDPTNRSLASWFENVEQPPSSDPAQTARWLREALEFLMTDKPPAILDFGGGDTALAKIIDSAPGIVEAMDEAGIAPVACYMLAPRLDDLGPLEAMERAGFRPKATVIILNEGRVDTTLTREEAFSAIQRHSVFKAALARGAMPIWLPRLEPDVMLEIEAKRLHFGHARDGSVPAGRTFSPIGGLRRSMVARWLKRMEQAHEPIRGWLP